VSDEQKDMQPVAWGMRDKTTGLILDVICPDEHERHAGDYTVPLYTANWTPEQVAKTNELAAELKAKVKVKDEPPVQPVPDAASAEAVTVDFDLSDGNRWGRAFYGDRKQEDGTWHVSGCLTPLPKAGSVVVVKGGFVLRCLTVKPMGNPRDGFTGTAEVLGMAP